MEANMQFDIRPIIKKLDHDLIEIRQRSLQNILSKINHNIIYEEDLIHHHELFINLFKLLNQKEEVFKVLSLLERLSKRSGGAQTLIGLGGTDFFTLLRHDVEKDPKIIFLVDAILNQLYNAYKQTSVTADQRSTMPLYQQNDPYYEHQKIQVIQDAYESEKKEVVEYSNFSINQQSSVENTTDYSTKSTNFLTITPEEDYFDFNWVWLTSSDRQILAVTHTRLKGSSPQLCIQSCKFFRDVLLHDFPTEVFIQRPNIVEAMLNAVVTFQESRSDVVKEILLCLHNLMESLYKRTLQNQNSDISRCKYDAENTHNASSISTNLTESSSLSSVSIVLNENGHVVSDCNQNVSNDKDGEFESSLMTEALIQAQKSGLEISLKIFSLCMDTLKIHVYDNNFFILVVQIVLKITDLLRLHSFPRRWDESNSLNNKYIYHLMTTIHKFDIIVEMIDSKKCDGSKDEQEVELKSVIVGKLLVKILQSAVPDSRIYEVLTESLVLFLQSILLKVTYMEYLPSLKHLLEHIMSHADDQFMQIYEKVKVVAKSFKRYDEFIQFKSTEASSLKQFISLANKILPSLYYFTITHFIKQVVNYSSHYFVMELQARTALSTLVLSLLSHQNEAVREETYNIVLSCLQGAFTDSLVSNPLSLKHQQALIFIQKEVLIEVTSNGLLHMNSKISCVAKNIISLLLNSHLNMSAKMWKSLITHMSESMCYIQAAAQDGETSFSKSVMTLLTYPLTVLDSCGNVTGLSSIDLTKSCLRLMFSNKKQIRQRGLALSLLRFNDYKATHNILLRKPLADDCHDLFIIPKTQSSSISQNSFENVSSANLLKLWQVLTDASVSVTLHHSAAQQIAILMQDKELQQQLLGKQVYKFCLDEVEGYLKTGNTQGHAADYLVSLITIVKLICCHQNSVREILSLQENVFLHLFGLTLACMNVEALRCESSSLLCLLVYNEVITYGDVEQLQIPSTIMKSYQLPIEFLHSDLTSACNHDYEHLEERFLTYIRHYCHTRCGWIHQIPVSQKLRLSKEETSKCEHASFKSISNSIVDSLSDDVEVNDSLQWNVEILTLLVVILESSNDQIIQLLKRLCSKNGLILRLLGFAACNGESNPIGCDILTMLHAVTDATSLDGGDIHNAVGSMFFTDVLSNIVQTDDQTPLCGSEFKIQLVSSISHHYAKCCSPDKSSNDVAPLIQALFHALSDTGSESYYDLPRMEVMLECLMHLLTKSRWSINTISGKSYCIKMFSWLTQIVISFHVERIGATLSFMGKGIVKKAVMCLCHLLHEIKTLDTDMSWLNTIPLISNDSNDSLHHYVASTSLLPWLLPLLSDRLTGIRWAGWALSTALISEDVGRNIVVQEFQHFPGGIWASSVSVMLDDKESSLVRRQACFLLSGILERTSKAASSSTNNSVWSSMIVQDTGTKDEINGIRAFLILLDHFQFYDRLQQIFSGESTCDSLVLVNASTSISPTSLNGEIDELGIKDDKSVQSKSSLYNHTTDRAAYVCLSLKSAIINLLRHIYLASEASIVHKLLDQQVIQAMFRVTPISASCSSTQVDKVNNELQHLVAKLDLAQLLMRDNHIECFTSVLLSFVESCFAVFHLCDKAVLIDIRVLINTWARVSSFLSFLITTYDDVTKVVHLFVQRNTILSFQRCLLDVDSNIKCASSANIKHILNFLLLLFKYLLTTNQHCIIDNIELPQDFSATVTGDPLNNKKINSGGEFFCFLLLRLQNKIFHANLSSLLKTSLACLFALSRRAQSFALANGFIEASIEDLKDFLVKLKMVALLNDTQSKKKKCCYLNELTDVIGLIRNACFKNEDVKKSYVSGDLVLHLNNTLGWCGQNVSLQTSVLQLLVVLSAQHSCKVQDAFFRTCNKSIVEDVHVFSHVIKLFMRLHGEVLSTHGKWNVLLRTCFQCITNMVESTEARSCLFKANIISLFSQILTLTENGNKYQRHVAKSLINDWLKMFSALSFYEDGARCLSKLPGCIPMFVHILTRHNQNKQEYVVLIYRNMLFLPGVKQAFTSNYQVVSVILQKVSSSKQSIKMKLFAASFFFSLLHDNQKAKACLKKVNAQVYLQRLQEEIIAGKYLSCTGNLELHDMLKYTVAMTIQLLTTGHQ